MPLPAYEELSDAPAYDELSDAPPDERPPERPDPAEPIVRPSVGATGMWGVGATGTWEEESPEQRRIRAAVDLFAARGEGATAETDLAEIERQQRSIGAFAQPVRTIANLPQRWRGEPDKFTRPLLQTSVPADDRSALAGVGRVGAKLVNSVFDPDEALKLMAFGGGAVPKLLATVPMAESVPEQVEHAATVLNDTNSTPADITEAVLDPLATGTMLGLAGHSSIPRPVETIIAKTEAAVPGALSKAKTALADTVRREPISDQVQQLEKPIEKGIPDEAIQVPSQEAEVLLKPEPAAVTAAGVSPTELTADIARYNQIKAEMGKVAEADPAGIMSMLESPLWKENEAIKAKYNGHSPVGPAAKAGKIVTDVENSTAVRAENEFGPKIAALPEVERAAVLEQMDARYAELTEQTKAIQEQANKVVDKDQAQADALIARSIPLEQRANAIKSAADVARGKAKPGAFNEKAIPAAAEAAPTSAANQTPIPARQAPVVEPGVGAVPQGVPAAGAGAKAKAGGADPVADTIETQAVDPASGAPVEPKPAAAETPTPIGQGAGGAMRVGELEPPKPFKTSNKNATIDAERKARGLQPMMDLERRSNQSAWDEAMRKIDEQPAYQDELIAELTESPRTLDPVDNAILMHRRIDLRNEHEKALHRWKEAFEGDDMVRAGEESARVKEWSNKLADLEDISKATGKAAGESLQARKMMANEDFSLAAMELRAREAKGGNLSAQEHIELIKAREKIAGLQRQIDALESGREGKEVETQTAETMKEVEKEAKTKPAPGAPTEEIITGRIKAKFDKGEQNAITPLVQQLARMLWQRGVRGQKPMIDGLHEILKTIDPEFTRDQTQRAFSGYGDFTPLSKAEIDVGLRDLKGQTQQVLKIEALEARKPLEKTGQERRTPSDEERRLIKQVNELKRKYGVVVTDPATQLKSALQSRKTYYEHRISDLKHEIETRQRIVKTKSPSPTDAELDLMIAEKDRLQSEHDSIFPKREITDEQKLKQAIAAADRNLAQWEVRLTNAEKGVFDSRVPGRKVTSPELELIQAEAAAIREHVKELKDFANPKKTAEERALQSLKTRMASQAVGFRKRLAEGDFAKRERKPVTLDAEANKLKAERDLAKEEFQAGLEKDRWEKTSVFGKTKARAGGVYDLIKTLMSTGEFSFVLRQGKGAFLEAIFSPKRAVIFAKAFRDGIRAMKSPLKQRTIENEIFNDPMYPQAVRDKLYVPEHGTELSRQEEFMIGRYSDAIPVVSAFNRAGETFLKKLRFDNYKLMSKAMTESGTPTPAEGKIIAASINEQTGRGGLGKAEPAAVLLNRALFSLRYLMSRLQLASGHQLWAGPWKGTGRARKAVAASYARMLIGGAAYYTLLHAFFNRDDKEATLETDFRSSDAGKLKMGDTRLDPMAGIAQVFTMGTRTATREAKDAKGRIFPITGKDAPYGKDWLTYATRFGRSKLHPAIGKPLDVYLERNMVNEEATLTSALFESGPMTYYDIYEALRAQDLSDGAALALLGLLGEGIQTYKGKPPAPNPNP